MEEEKVGPWASHWSGAARAGLSLVQRPHPRIGTEEEEMAAKESDIHRLQICQNDERREM